MEIKTRNRIQKMTLKHIRYKDFLEVVQDLFSNHHNEQLNGQFYHASSRVTLQNDRSRGMNIMWMRAFNGEALRMGLAILRENLQRSASSITKSIKWVGLSEINNWTEFSRVLHTADFRFFMHAKWWKICSHYLVCSHQKRHNRWTQDKWGIWRTEKKTMIS